MGSDATSEPNQIYSERFKLTDMVKKYRPPYRTLKSQEVLRQKAFETTFSTPGARAQSGALSAKPRVVRGIGQLPFADSQLEVLVLAERQGFEPWIRLTVYRISSPAHSTTLPSLRCRNGAIISIERPGSSLTPQPSFV